MKTILAILLILLAVYFNYKPDFVVVNEHMTNECYYDMTINSNLICD